MKTPPYPSTPKQARAWFKRYGICIADWCKQKGLDHGAVVDLLREKSKGTRGKAHVAAIALGLKEDPEKDQNKHAA
jgi:gp16 family phage-associated protein